MKILVTGGLGFIGQHLCLNLRVMLDAHQIVIVDRRDGADYVRDLRFESLAPILDNERPDMVVHLAAQVGRLFGEDDVRESVRSNAEMTTMVARACGERGIRVAYTSTSEVYGDRGETVCTEDIPLELPHNIYGLSKRWGEEVVQMYTAEPLIFRLSMPYGPGAPPGRGRRALDTFLWQAHHRMPLTVHSGSERSWCWVGDTVWAMAKLIEQGKAGVWNIGRDDDPVAMIDLAKMCCDLVGAPRSLIQLVEAPPRQTVVKRLDTSKIRSIGWEPTVELPEGLVRVYEWVSQFDRDGNLEVARAEQTA